MINPNEFDFDQLHAALKDARAKHLTLCVASDGGWAQERADAYLPNQLCRVSENFSRAGLEQYIRAEIAAINDNIA